MKIEKEITVKVNCDYETLDRDLKKKGFEIVKKYKIEDFYFVPNNIEIEKETPLDVLKKCILVRNIGDFVKMLTYKYKKYSDTGDIIEQGKTECEIVDIDSTIEFLKVIGYKKLIDINDTIIVYSNSKIEFAVQLVNDKYIFIEMEDDNRNTGKFYNTIEEMIKDFKSIDIDCDYSNFFVKKAELVLKDNYNN